MQFDGFGLGLRFHQFGLAVPVPEDAFRFLGGLGCSAGAAKFDPLPNVNVTLHYHPAMPDVEVVWSEAGRPTIDQPVRHGHMACHLCYISNDPQTSLNAMMASGLDLLEVRPPTPIRLFGGVPVSFHTVDRFTLTEPIHCTPRPMDVR